MPSDLLSLTHSVKIRRLNQQRLPSAPVTVPHGSLTDGSALSFPLAAALSHSTCIDTPPATSSQSGASVRFSCRSPLCFPRPPTAIATMVKCWGWLHSYHSLPLPLLYRPPLLAGDDQRGAAPRSHVGGCAVSLITPKSTTPRTPAASNHIDRLLPPCSILSQACASTRSAWLGW
jgi:hypothetical protein